MSTNYEVHLIPLKSKYSLRTLFSSTLSLCSSLSVRDQVSNPYKATGRIMVLYIVGKHCWETIFKNKFSSYSVYEISGFQGASMKMTAFWDIVQCTLVEVDRRFRGAYCLHLQFDSATVFADSLQTNILSLLFPVEIEREI
jgi:hypothetical protein